jgi:hypothetical protein
MFITLGRRGFVHHIATIWLFSSHCDDEVMFITLRQYGYDHSCSSHCDNMVMTRHARHIAKNIFMATHVLHIATISLCLSHCDNMVMENHVQPLSTMVNHSQPWSWSIKVNHIYVRHIVTIWLCSSHRMFNV